MRRTMTFMKDWLFTYKDGEKMTLDLLHMWVHYYWNMLDFAADARNQGGIN